MRFQRTEKGMMGVGLKWRRGLGFAIVAFGLGFRVGKISL
jgi:hypothetical protein